LVAQYCARRAEALIAIGAVAVVAWRFSGSFSFSTWIGFSF
jgi:hypothetical protein